MISVERLADVFVDVADTLVDEFDLLEFLTRLTHHVAAVSGMAAVGVLLADQHNELHYMAASTERAELMELFQLQNAEGPCLDCFHRREPVANSDLAAAEQQWPLFAPRAMDEGFRSVHAFPMRLRDHVIGALNVFGNDTSPPLESNDVRIVQSLTDVATIALLQERVLRHAETLTEQLQSALNSRILIEQAKGVIARAADVSVDEAFDLLRTQARRRQLKLSDLARAVVDDPAAYISDLSS